MSDRFWIVGRYVTAVADGVVWEFQGLFDDEAPAVAACAGHPDWFVVPVKLGGLSPDETTDWPGLYYPAAQPSERAT